MFIVSNLTAPHGQAPANPAKIITGEYLAKATCKYPVERRAEDAVRWLGGEVQVKPTAKLACEVFNVSYPRLKQAQARLGQCKHSKHPLSDQALERIVVETGVDRVWRVIDRLTAPELPLAAAE